MTWSARASQPAWRGRAATRPGSGAQLDLKRLELLHEFVPHARRIAVLKDPTAVTVKEYQLEPAAARLDLELAIFTARNADEVGRALDGIAAANEWLRKTVRATGAYLSAEEAYSRPFVFALGLDCNGTRACNGAARHRQSADLRARTAGGSRGKADLEQVAASRPLRDQQPSRRDLPQTGWPLIWTPNQRMSGKCSKVAAGTAVASRPPHRSGRALLTHRAPPSGRTSAEPRQRLELSLGVKGGGCGHVCRPSR
jgi:hypothetical protein